jgi:hypothetical protein
LHNNIPDLLFGRDSFERFLNRFRLWGFRNDGLRREKTSEPANHEFFQFQFGLTVAFY